MVRERNLRYKSAFLSHRQTVYKRSLKNQNLAGGSQGVELQARVSITWLSFSDFHPIIPHTGKFFYKASSF